MHSHLRPRLTYANVVSTLCLFLLLGGGAFAAATTLPANSVGTAQLKNGAVSNPKLADGAVTGSKVANHALTGKQIKSSTLGTVPSASHAANSDELGGAPASGFQKRVSGTCAAGTAVQSVAGDGTVGCGTTTPSGSAGGALSGTYPNPSIASGAVDTSNFASGATAPDASHLGGIGPSGFLQGSGLGQSFNYSSTTFDTSSHFLFSLGGLTLYLNCTGGIPDLLAYTSVSHSAVRAFGLNTSHAADNMSFNTGYQITPSSGGVFAGTIVYSTPAGSNVNVIVSTTCGENLYGNGAEYSATGFALSG